MAVKSVNFGQGIAAYNAGAVSFADGEIGGLQLTAAGLLKVDLSGNSAGVAGGTSYTEGDIDTTITGTAIMWEDTGDTLRAVSAAKPLPVSLQNATVAVTQSGTWNIGTVTAVTTVSTVTAVTTLGTITNVVHIDDNSGSITVDGTIAATQSGTWNIGTVTTLTGITNVVHIDDNSGSITVDGTVAISGSVSVTNAGTFAVQATLAAETTKVIGTVNIAASQTIAVTNAGTFATQATLQAGTAIAGYMTQTPTASGGNSLSFDRQTALSNTAVAVKASAGRVYKVHFYNPNATIAFVQVYNTAQGSVTVGTTTPVWTWAVPAGGVIDDSFDTPMTFGTAITIAATTTITGGTAPTTGLLSNIGYI